MSHACKIVDSIPQLAQEGKLGDRLRRLCTASVTEALAATARSLVNPLQQMIAGLTHGDFYPHSTGWRRESGEMVIFDLATVGFEPRFFDVAPWLGAPDSVQPRCASRDDLAGYYLAEYTRWGGRRVATVDFLEETRILWMAWVLMNLAWWRDRAIKGPLDPTQEDGKEYRLSNMEELYRQLDSVLGEIS
jgi:hypothetical protein